MKYNLNKKDERRMWVATSLWSAWFIVLIINLFIFEWNIVLGFWFLITGLIMALTQKSYTKWYNRVYNTNY